MPVPPGRPKQPPSLLRLAVARRGFTVRQLAGVLGCSHPHLLRVLNGERPLTDAYRARLLGLGFAAEELATEPLAVAQAEAIGLADRVLAARRAQGLPDQLDPEVVQQVARILAKALTKPEPARRAARHAPAEVR